MDKDLLITVIVVAVILIDMLRKAARPKVKKSTPPLQTPTAKRQSSERPQSYPLEEIEPAEWDAENGHFEESLEESKPQESKFLPESLEKAPQNLPSRSSRFSAATSPQTPPSPKLLPPSLTTLSHLQELVVYKEILDKPRCLAPLRCPW